MSVQRQSAELASRQPHTKRNSLHRVKYALTKETLAETAELKKILNTT